MYLFLDIYRRLMQTTLAMQIQYRVGMVIWMMTIIIPPVIYTAVWQSAAGGGELADFDAADFAAYYVVFIVVWHFVQHWHMWNYEYHVRVGNFSALLLRPLHPMHGDIAENLTFKFFMLLVLIPTVIGLTLTFHPRFEPPLWAVLAFLPALLLAGALSFLVGSLFALAAFWITRTQGINHMYNLFELFCSGQIAPLALLPAPLRLVADVLPFRWTMAFPIELLLGRLSPEETLSGFAAQVLWLLGIYALLTLGWRVSIRHYGAVGG